MASTELERSCGTVAKEEESRRSNIGSNNTSSSTKKKSKRKFFCVPKFGCFRLEQDDDATVGRSGNRDSMDLVSDSAGARRSPTHLIVMVNGLVGSAQDWRFAAKQFLKKYPEDVIVHCSDSNSSMLTFHGVDVMGERLAKEVLSVTKSYPDVRKISFIGHSLGGLVARYTIARLYQRENTHPMSKGSGDCETDESEAQCPEQKLKSSIAGLEPINFITVATPHLGSRWHKQVPVFCGLYTLEKAASHTSLLLGRTGKHLFLTDRDNGKPPLLFQMVNDCEDLPFLSALGSFRHRVAYANARFDSMVGWSTASLRHPKELPDRRHLLRNEKYPHIVNVEAAKTANDEEVPLEAKANGDTATKMEEAMLRGLTKLSWERVDVNFSGSRQRFLAHNTIQVKTYCINSDGADVIQHMVDNFLL